MDGLELHRIRHRLRGLPIYEDDEIVDVIDEPEWEWDALTEDQQAVIHRDVIRCQARGGTWDEMFPFVLGDYGIACPHKWENHEPTWRECRWCRASEQLPGRIVTIKGQTFRVTDPPPPTIRVAIPVKPSAYVPDAPVGPSCDAPEIIEYRWNGSHYEAAR